MRALTHLIQNSGRVISRDQLLDAITDHGSEKNDRSVDFIINRLRRKLGDNARKPLFIKTLYGEGYTWVGPDGTQSEDYADADLIVGPIRGFDDPASADGFARSYFSALKASSEPDHSVAFAPDFDASIVAGATRPDVHIELTRIRDGDRMECVVVAKSLRTGQILDLARHPLNGKLRQPPGFSATDFQQWADAIVAKLWVTRTSVTITSQPLPVAMHDAASRPQSGGAAWDAADKHIRKLRELSPDDPQLKLMYATHLHTKYVMKGVELFRKGTATCAEDEAEIEQLVIESLEFAQTNPDYSAMAGKLLYFVDPGYHELALELAEKAHRSDMNVASSLVIVGQLRGFLGNIEPAVEALEQAVSLTKPGTEFHTYCLVLLCQALQAGGRTTELATARQRLYKQSVLAAVFFELLFSDADAPSLRARAATLALSRSRAQGLLTHLWYVSTRLFENETHRENSIRLPIKLFTKRFGPSIVPEDIRQSVPRLFLD